MKKLVSLLLSIVLVFGVMSPAALAAAENDTVQPRYLRISTLTISLDISSSGKSACYCKVMTHESTDSVTLTMELQRLEDDDWNTIKTWTGSGGRITYLDKSWYVLRGYEYQLKITAEVYDSTGTLMETQVDYSYPVTY